MIKFLDTMSKEERENFLKTLDKLSNNLSQN